MSVIVTIYAAYQDQAFNKLRAAGIDPNKMDAKARAVAVDLAYQYGPG